MTIPGSGHPIAAILLMGELVRLGADFTFLRRTFWQDVAGLDAADAVASILEAAERASERDAWSVERDRAELVEAIEELDAAGRPK